jgi:hypothetical protein
MNEIAYLKASNGSGEAPRASVTVARSTGATTLTVDAVTNWPTYFVATSGVLNVTTGVLNPATIKVFKGHIASGKIEIETFAPGYTDTGNAVGDVVVLKPNTKWADIIAASFADVAVSIAPGGALTTAATTQATTATKTALQADTNFRTKQRVSIAATAATLTPDIGTASVYELNAQATALTIAAPAGTPNEKDIMLFFIKDNGTARAITWNAAFVNISGLDSLITTVISKWHVVGCVYNATLSKWQIVSITTEA